MGEMRFEFSSPNGVTGAFAYGRDPDGGGRLTVQFSSHKLRQKDGSPKTFSLGFNNIGKDDPLGFLESLDQGYLNDKLPALSARRYDLFQTIAAVRHLLDEQAQDLEPDEIEAAEQTIDRSAAHFDGDHRSACEGLIHALIRADLPCFQDDPFHLIGHRCTLENRIFERVVWPALIEAIEDHLSMNPELETAIEAIVVGVPLSAPDEEDDWAEPDPSP
jgi:hypothetical protein